MCSDRHVKSTVRGALAATAVLAAAGCAAPTSNDADDTQIVLAEGYELGGYNPVNGYAESGVSPIYEGLYRPSATADDVVPDLAPALAQGAPEPAGPNRWRIPLRAGVQFSDGTAFDSADVVATYAAVADPAVASEIATAVAPIVSVVPDGPEAVTVELATAADPRPYLLLGILPSERVESAPAGDWAVNTEPVGTGPYRLDSLRPDQAVLVAREDYWGTPAQVDRLVYTYTPDDNSRAQSMASGAVDGTNLPPRLIDSLNADDVATVAVNSADWRGIALPAGNPFTAEVHTRLAMNLGVDREAIVRDVLRGYGRQASTPVAEAYGAAYNPDAQYDFGADEASSMLDAASWRVSSDGIREKGGARASFELLYNAQDTLRRDLAVAFAAAMKPLGIDVRPAAPAGTKSIRGSAIPQSCWAAEPGLTASTPRSMTPCTPGCRTPRRTRIRATSPPRVWTACSSAPRSCHPAPRKTMSINGFKPRMRPSPHRFSWCSSTTPTPTATSAGTRVRRSWNRIRTG